MGRTAETRQRRPALAGCLGLALLPLLGPADYGPNNEFSLLSVPGSTPPRPEVPVAIAPRVPDEHPGCPRKRSEPVFCAKMVPVAPSAAPHVVPPLNTAGHSSQDRAAPCWPRLPAQAIGRAALRPPIGAGHAPTAGNRTWKVTIGGDGCKPRLPKLSIGCMFGVVRCYWAEWHGPPFPPPPQTLR